MHDTFRRLTILSTALCAAILLQACGGKSSAPSTAGERIRGTIQSLDGQVLTVTTSTGPVQIQLAPSTPVASVITTDRSHITDGSFLGIGSVTAPDGSLRAAEVTVFPESMRGTGEGSYPWNGPTAAGGSGNMTNGTAGSMNMTNGTASASTMTNGTASSTMTNGTVSTSTMTNGTASDSRATNGTPPASKMTNGTASAQPGGASLTLTYKDGSSRGSQTIAIPAGIPIVALEPATQSELRPGVHVLVLASRGSGGALTADRVLAGKNGLVPPM